MSTPKPTLRKVVAPVSTNPSKPALVARIPQGPINTEPKQLYYRGHEVRTVHLGSVERIDYYQKRRVIAFTLVSGDYVLPSTKIIGTEDGKLLRTEHDFHALGIITVMSDQFNWDIVQVYQNLLKANKHIDDGSHLWEKFIAPWITPERQIRARELAKVKLGSTLENLTNFKFRDWVRKEFKIDELITDEMSDEILDFLLSPRGEEGGYSGVEISYYQGLLTTQEVVQAKAEIKKRQESRRGNPNGTDGWR
jgi:hypothetical protein